MCAESFIICVETTGNRARVPPRDSSCAYFMNRAARRDSLYFATVDFRGVCFFVIAAGVSSAIDLGARLLGDDS